MKPALKAKWIAALKSGRYKQGHGVLEKNGRYCCLGVLCKVAREQIPDGETYLSEEQCARFGIADELQRELASLNDGESVDAGHSDPTPFPEIAEHIRGAV